MNPLHRLLHRFGTAALDLLYPPLCLGCEARLPSADTLTLLLCPACLRALPTPPDGAIEARLARLPDGAGAFGVAHALWTFDDGGTLQRLQHALKYGGRPSLGVAAGRVLGQAWQRAGLPAPDAVVPVPLSRTRALERGYNQAERLAAGLADALGADLLPRTLTRTRRTRTQTALSRQKRWGNVDGAFALAEGVPLPAGRRILLVDDVLTTGSTALAAAAPLRSAGALVDLAALALARD